MMDKVFRTAVILTAQDEMSRKIAEAVDEADKKLQKMAWSAQKTGKTMMQVGAAAGASLFLPVSTAIDFEAQMSKVGAVSRATGEQLAALTAEARRLGATTDRSASEAAQAMEFLAMAGLTVEQQLKSTEGIIQLAGAAGMGLGRTADLATNILGGFRMEVEQLGRVNDVMVNTLTSSNVNLEELGEAMKMAAPIAAGLGGEIEEVSAMIGLLANVGIKGTMSGTALRAAYQRLAAPTGAAAATLAALNVEIEDSDGNMRTLTEIIGDLADATEYMGDVARAAVMKDIFGERAAGAMTELMEQASGDEIRRFTEEVGRSGAAAEVYAQMMDNTKGSIKEALSALESLQIMLGTLLLPTLEKWIDRGRRLFIWMERFATENQFLTSIIMKGVAAFAAFMVVVGGGLYAFGKMLDLFRFFLPVGVKVIRMFRLMTAVAMANPWAIIAAAIIAAVYLIYRYWGPITDFFARLWANIKAGFEKGFIHGVLNIFKLFSPVYWMARAIGAVTEYLFGVNLFDAGANVLKTLWEGMKAMAGKPIEVVADMAKKIRDYLPFSPAKVGPLRDLDKIRIVETIAETINPRPVQQAMAGALAPVAGGAVAIAGGGARVSVNYSPTIYAGGADRQSLEMLLQEHGRDLIRRFQEAMDDYNRTRF